MSRMTRRVVIALVGLLVVLVAVRGWSVARHQFDAPGEGIARGDTSDVTPETIDQLLKIRQTGTASASEITALLGRASGYLTTGEGQARRIEVEVAGTTKKALGRATAVVLLNLDGGMPFRMLAWRFQPSHRPQ